MKSKANTTLKKRRIDLGHAKSPKSKKNDTPVLSGDNIEESECNEKSRNRVWKTWGHYF